MGVQSVLGGELAWYSEFDAAPSRILAHHHPDVPNLGDMTAIDWRKVHPVDVLTGGTPCQDLSHAGKRAGMTDGTRSNLWVQMREAIHVIRPKLVVWENVRGAYSACADSEVGRCPRCVGDDPRARHRPSLRALGRVLGDLSSLGYDASWYGIRASDVGACHGRFRVFVWATPADADHSGWGEHWRAEPVRQEQSAPQHVRVDATDMTLLPTPAVNDMGAGKTPDAWDAWDAWTDRMRAEHGNGNGHGKSLEIEALRLLPTPRTNGAGAHGDGGMDLRTVAALLPTPRATDGTKGGPNQRGSSGDLMLPSAVQQLLPTPAAHEPGGTLAQYHERLRRSDGRNSTFAPLSMAVQSQDWAQYEAAIRRHEDVLGRAAPAPTEPGPKGGARLAPTFVEFMMMLPAGHVTNPAIWEGMTDKRGRVLTGDRLKSAARNAELKALGNGVVPLQCAATGRMWLADMAEVVAS